MIDGSKLQYVLLVLAATLTLAVVFANSPAYVILAIAILGVSVLSIALLIPHWKTQEAIRSAWVSIVLAAGAIISYKLQHSGVLLLVPGGASVVFAIFAVKEFRRAASAQRAGDATAERG